MELKARLNQWLDGVKNAVPARRPALRGPYVEEPEAYGDAAPEGWEDYPGEDYPPEYEEGWEEYVPEDYPPEEDLPGEVPPYGYSPAAPVYGDTGEEIPSLEEPEAPEALYDPEDEDDIPIEEFSPDELDELDEPEAPEPLNAPAAEPSPGPAPDWEVPEPEEPLEEDPRRRPRLLSRKGRLRHPGWAETDLYEYNKERMRFPARRKEWELYQLHNDRFALFICYGHAAYMSLVEVSFLDFATGERFHAGKRQFLPGDSLDLDFSGGQPHSLKYEDEELFLSLSFDGELRRIQIRSAELEAELSCHDAGDAMVTAVPFEARGQFAYNYKKIFRDLFGHVSLHGVDRSLDGDTFMTLWSGRGVWPYRYSTLWAAGAQETEEGVLALNLGGGYGREDAPTENALFLDGKLVKLGRVYFRFSSEDPQKPWRMVDRERRIKLSFRPVWEDTSERNWLLLSTRSHQLYGRLSGHIELPDGSKREIRDMAFFCQYGVYRW